MNIRDRFSYWLAFCIVVIVGAAPTVSKASAISCPAPGELIFTVLTISSSASYGQDLPLVAPGCAVGATFSTEATMLSTCLKSGSSTSNVMGAPAAIWSTPSATDVGSAPHRHSYSIDWRRSGSVLGMQNMTASVVCANCPAANTVAFNGETRGFDSADSSGGVCTTDAATSGLKCSLMPYGITVTLGSSGVTGGTYKWTGSKCGDPPKVATAKPECQTIAAGTQVCQSVSGQMTINGRLISNAGGNLMANGASLSPGTTASIDLGTNGSDGRITGANGGVTGANGQALTPAATINTTNNTTSTTTNTFNYFTGAQVNGTSSGGGSGGTGEPGEGEGSNEPTKIDETGTPTSGEFAPEFDQEAAKTGVLGEADKNPADGVDFAGLLPNFSAAACQSITMDFGSWGQIVFPGPTGCVWIDKLKALLAWAMYIATVWTCLLRVFEEI